MLLKQDEKVLAAINSKSPSELAQLAMDENWLVRDAVAWNVYTLPKTLAWLGENSEEKRILCTVAMHHRTPPRTLALLADSHHPDVRLRVASHEKTPRDVLVRMADKDDENQYVLQRLAFNKRTPRMVRFRLFLEHPEWVERQEWAEWVENT